MAITVASLHCYPVKSLRGHDLPRADMRAEGIAGDRRWLIVDTSGRSQTQRELRRMAQLDVAITPSGLEISHHEAGRLVVAAPSADAAPIDVVVWDDRVPARLASSEAAQWLSVVLGADVRLVFMHDVASRPVAAKYARPGEHVSFADGFPLLVTTVESLADLNARGMLQHTMRQFRPNIVVSGAAAWAEDTWKLIKIGAVTMRIAKPCARCIVTTLDPDTGAQRSETEPLQTLGSFHRTANGRIIFGQNAVAITPGQIAVGDAIEIIETGRSNLA